MNIFFVSDPRVTRTSELNMIMNSAEIPSPEIPVMAPERVETSEPIKSQPTAAEQIPETQAALQRTEESLDHATQSIEEEDDQLAQVRSELGLQPAKLPRIEDNIRVTQLESRQDELGSQEKILQAQNLIEQTGGAIDTETKPYKNFDKAKHERFLIQKGEIDGQDVVFKVGEAKDERTVQNESRNLKAIELAPVKPDEALDVHFVRQVGDVYKNDKAVGLATEYIQDDPELKKQLSAQQKIEVMANVIDNLQRLTVTDAARESGMPVHDGQKISRDSQYFLQQLVIEGRLDQATAEALQRQFQAAETSLIAEEPVFVHGDAHGDNIFVNQKEDGTLDTAVLDFEGLRISNKYHDWSELINKSVFLKHIQKDKPELFEPIKRNVENMWLDASVEFDEQAIINKVSGGDPEKARNFKLTRMYDMLNRIMSGKNSESPMAQERVNLYLEQLKKNVGSS